MLRQLAFKRHLPRTIRVPNLPSHPSPQFLKSKYQPTQSFSSWNIFEKMQLQREIRELEERARESSDPRLIVQYIRTLAKQRPNEAAAYLQAAWRNQKLPVDELTLREYVRALAAGDSLDKLNLQELFAMYRKQQGIAAAAPKSTSAQVFAQSAAMPFTAGSTPSQPIYIAYQENGWKSQAWKLARHGITLFLIVALVSAFLDEKSAAGSIGSRLGMGSAVHQAEKSEKTFDDVVGIDEAKSELQEIVMYLKDPKKFTRLGGKLPKGILLTGPPGTGKTLLARAIAGEAKVPFFHASGSEFEEMYVGVGAKRVRELFDIAKTKSPCIIFIDEIDAIGGSRHLKDQSAMKMTLNQLLVEMDGFQQNNGIIVIAATNFPDSLDSALIRPGRFDKTVDVPMPDIGGRKAILSLYCKKVPLDSDVDLDQLARGTPGFSGAELFNLVNQAALKASVDGLKTVTMQALEYAKDKILMGAERKSAIIAPETLKMTAFHEAGHALVALKTKGADPVHKATIMPRGRALGMVVQLPDGDQTSMTRQQMLARIDVCMGGRVAEELVFGEDNVTSGASSDIQQATRLARAMVTKFGLSSKVGIVFIDEKQPISGAMNDEIDREVREILTASYARAKKLLEQHSRELELLANGLMEYESLSGSEVVELTQGRPISQVKRSQKPSRALQTIEVMKERSGVVPSLPKQPLVDGAPLAAAEVTIPTEKAHVSEDSSVTENMSSDSSSPVNSNSNSNTSSGKEKASTKSNSTTSTSSAPQRGPPKL